MANTQLTRIVAPNINEVDYAKKMQDVFNNINENFAKIASLPFIQGVQGDSYQLVEKPIWKKNGSDINNATLTKDGAILLGSIFKKSFSVGKTFNNVRTDLRELTISINGKDVNPIDFFKDSEGNITNNTLYFYAVINDSGDEEEKQLGQYYYFVDARLKVLGDVYYGTDKSILSSFTDYTGFYQYKPKTDSEPEKYDKISILPSLYYDQYKDDICWKFNGNESGVSAIGVKGMDGKDSSFQIVHVTLNDTNTDTNDQSISNTTSGEVDGVFNFNKTNKNPIWSNDTSNVVEGNAIISITYNSNTVYLAYGEIKYEEEKKIAYWNLDTVIDKLAYGTINSYFYDMRNVDSIPANTPRYIAIPAITNSDADPVSAHTISNAVKDPADLKFQYAPEVFTGPDSSQKKLLDDSADESGNIKRKAIFENYNVEIKKGDLDIPKGKIRIGTTDGVGTIYTPTKSYGSYAIQLNAGGTTYNDAAASIKAEWSGTVGIGLVKVRPKLEVSGNCYISKDLTVNGKADLVSGATINGNATINDNLTIKNHLTFKNTGQNAGATSVNIIQVEEKTYNTDRHLDLRTDGFYLSKGEFGNYNKTINDANAVHQYIDGHLDVYGKATINNGATINGGVKPDFIQLNACNFTEMQNLATGGGTTGYYDIEWKNFINMSTYFTTADNNLVYGKHGIYVKQNPITVGSAFTVNIKNAPKYALINLFYKGITTGRFNIRYFKLQINGGEVFSENKAGRDGYDWDGIIYTGWTGGRRI